jgi:hypothetical protein
MAAMVTIYTAVFVIMAHKLLGLIVHLPDSVIAGSAGLSSLGGAPGRGGCGESSRLSVRQQPVDQAWGVQCGRLPGAGQGGQESNWGWAITDQDLSQGSGTAKGGGGTDGKVF